MVSEEDSPLQKCKHPELPYQVSYRQELSFTICVILLCLSVCSTVFLNRPPKAMHVRVTRVEVIHRDA